MNASLLMEHDVSRQSDYVCCLIEEGTRCNRSAGNASYGKRIQKTVQQRDLKMTQDPSCSHKYICDHHKSVIQSVRATRNKRQGTDGSSVAGPSFVQQPTVQQPTIQQLTMQQPTIQQPTVPPVTEVNFNSLSLVTLRKYKKHYNLPNKQGTNKAQLANVVKEHFKTIPVDDEHSIISEFISKLRNKNAADNAAGAGSSTQGISAIASALGGINTMNSGFGIEGMPFDQFATYPVKMEGTSEGYGARSSTARYGAGPSTAKGGAGTSVAKGGTGSSTGKGGTGSSTSKGGARSSTGKGGAGSSAAKGGAGSSTGKGGAGSTGKGGVGSSTARGGTGSSTGRYGAGASRGGSSGAGSSGTHKKR